MNSYRKRERKRSIQNKRERLTFINVHSSKINLHHQSVHKPVTLFSDKCDGKNCNNGTCGVNPANALAECDCNVGFEGTTCDVSE